MYYLTKGRKCSQAKLSCCESPECFQHNVSPDKQHPDFMFYTYILRYSLTTTTTTTTTQSKAKRLYIIKLVIRDWKITRYVDRDQYNVGIRQELKPTSCGLV